MSNGSAGIWKYILVPAVITLVVTVIRLIGELQHWNQLFFGRSAGGGGAIVGIVWLAFVFAVYFAVKLQNDGETLGGKGKAIGLCVLALLVFVGGQFLYFSGSESHSAFKSIAGVLVTIAALAIMRAAWPSLWNVLLAYALAARIPVIIVMYFALSGNWGTHYDAAPPNMSYPDLSGRFIHLGVIPQLLFWVPLTVIFCGLFGVITAAVRKPKPTEAAA